MIIQLLRAATNGNVFFLNDSIVISIVGMITNIHFGSLCQSGDLLDTDLDLDQQAGQKKNVHRCRMVKNLRLEMCRSPSIVSGIGSEM